MSSTLIKAENQRKTREKSKVAENQVFWLDFCAKKGLWATGHCEQRVITRNYGVMSLITRNYE